MPGRIVDDLAVGEPGVRVLEAGRVGRTEPPQRALLVVQVDDAMVGECGNEQIAEILERLVQVERTAQRGASVR